MQSRYLIMYYEWEDYLHHTAHLCSTSHVVYERDGALTDSSTKAEHDDIFGVFARNISSLTD